MTGNKIGLTAAAVFAFAFGLGVAPAAIAACSPNCAAQCEVQRKYCRDVELRPRLECDNENIVCLRFCASGCKV